MSEIMSGLAGSELVSEFTGTTNLNPTNNVAKQAEGGDTEGFPALFASLTEPADDASLALTNLTESGLPMLFAGELNPELPVTTGQATFSSMASYGNFLPQGQPIITVSGQVASGDQSGATAMTFLGDGKYLLMSAPHAASNISSALQASAQQVNESLELPALKFADDAVGSFPFAEAIKRSDITALANLSNDSDLSMPLQMNSTLTNTHPVHVSMPNADLTAVTNAAPKPEAMMAGLNQPQWNQEIGERLNWIIANGLKQAEIRLNPPELGQLEVRIQLQGDQANVQFSSPHAQVREALDAALPRLREMLAETGLTLGDANISQHSFANSQSGEEQQQRGQGTSTAHINSKDIESDSLSGRPVMLSGTSMLDVFA